MTLRDVNRDEAKASAKLLHKMGGHSRQPTPWLVRIAVVIGIWIASQGLIAMAKVSQADPGLGLIGITSAVIQVVTLIAIWRLRKWGVYGYAIFAALNLDTIASLGGKFEFTILGLRLLILIPAIIHWRKLT